MKTIFSFIGVLLCATSFAGLSPAATTEFCPKTNLSFTYTVSGNQYISSFSNNLYTVGSTISTSYSSSTGITTFSFTLNFDDNSQNHSITLNWSDGNTSSGEVLDFPKIKSLYGYSLVPSLNVSNITVDSCATNTTSVSFTNLQWKNTTTNTSFGTITEYEYSVPAGWKVNSFTSTNKN